MLPKLLVLQLLLECVYIISAYKHVILMHGLFGNPEELSQLAYFIKKVHPGTTITAIDAYNHEFSLSPMWEQTEKIRAMMSEAMKKHKDGVHMICYSQGGLVCRAALQTLQDHNVHNFISLSSPQGGQFGDTKFLRYILPQYTKEILYNHFAAYDSNETVIDMGKQPVKRL
ncbi:hypothetical protein LSH36_834g02053 [Paralvinella palmiformis]|uniref:palmitoyl-CoA hydrolase n=1 Tax=Paralvinella palmiformis TaxID=53620 RepID=A0AAD9MTG7_9ANNE|nr:hypothetical protein LSH36_834g02053 [Paralvinella palmiformis]